MKPALLAIVLPCLTAAAWNGPYPGPGNTGPTTPDALTPYSGPTTITVDGTVIESVTIDATITIEADNVTIRNFVINTEGFYGVKCINGNTGLVLEDGAITRIRSAGVYGGGFTARRLDIHDCGSDAYKPTTDARIEYCWMHDLGYIVDSHSDGVQMVAGGNVVIYRNYFDMPYQTSGYTNSQCIILQTNNGTLDNVTIEENLINGGGYSVQVRDKGTGYGPPTTIRIVNNLFGRDYQFGPAVTEGSPEIAGNLWDDTRECMSINTAGCGAGITQRPGRRAFRDDDPGGRVFTLTGRCLTKDALERTGPKGSIHAVLLFADSH